MAEAVKESDRSEVRTIAGRNPDALADFQVRHVFPQQLIGYDAVLTDPDIDVVIVGLPYHVHHTLTINAARRGKAVLSEKSLTISMEQAHALIDRFTQILNDGRLGNLRSVRGYYAADIWKVTNPDGKGTI